jgi:hypothetical protein
MKLAPHWRVLTIGDGDLSFSESLVAHKGISHLTASVLDSEQTLTTKYEANSAHSLNSAINVLYEFDVTKPAQWPESFNTVKNSFDVVIFQFPLVPSETTSTLHHQGIDANIANRWLLRQFLINCQQYFWSPDGARLAYISLKDVKFYIHWDIEHSLMLDTSLYYLGKMLFNSDDFPGYRIRNVDRDKKVKGTLGHTYVYSDSPANHNDLTLTTLPTHDPLYCTLCKQGPFLHSGDLVAHQQGKKHLQLAKYHQNWLQFLERVKNNQN